ncbi:MAG: hypothetical protein UY92_C0004G0048 [Candidatus Magasanikbacteria bacterium GW2011_GWA2_56_11]|uniref:Uncharacterized protein n=1 Tax=Candidatus Magasanikbacteria bacterium GW2011_GWA2_56_11 TaxID=1619044 RepID=A0A0G2AN12_9BACT|nr:MAG: hypothetical protein UY92_C0004G0048 [Candidatus Magasanikbacteria bacterium GW2011_GWA2_56_11]
MYRRGVPIAALVAVCLFIWYPMAASAHTVLGGDVHDHGMPTDFQATSLATAGHDGPGAVFEQTDLLLTFQSGHDGVGMCMRAANLDTGGASLEAHSKMTDVAFPESGGNPDTVGEETTAPGVPARTGRNHSSESSGRRVHRAVP